MLRNSVVRGGKSWMSLGAAGAEVRRLELEIVAALERVKEFERRYGMSSEEFLQRYVKGELGDEESYMEWYGELMFLEKARKELEELRLKVGML